MGRHAGWIAVHSGIAGGADVILIPEQPLPIHEVCALLDRRHRGGKDFSIVVVSEGYELEASRGSRGGVDQFEPTFGPAAARRRRPARARDRGAHRLRDPRHRARPCAARRLTHAARPRAGDALGLKAADLVSSTASSAGWRRSRATTSSTFRSPRRSRSSRPCRQIGTRWRKRSSGEQRRQRRDVSTALDTSVAPGLTHADAAALLAKVGPNILAEPKRPSDIRRFAANLVHLFALLLWLGAALALLGGLPQLTAAIVVVILVNAVFAFVQESRAERASEALRRVLPRTARVRRDGEGPRSRPRSLSPATS